ncbi:hypothetical protein Glove_856g50 [Diversispora epigaea]|uniref:Protein kinase domain-containing protein n=1 Tax=Diversispora epigaea TaxID=1348612 RepID=A0A397G1Q3_9GLOM|nr:hypothetical protein Glove_856g50 [Diversispora epigaea]
MINQKIEWNEKLNGVSDKNILFSRLYKTVNEQELYLIIFFRYSSFLTECNYRHQKIVAPNSIIEYDQFENIEHMTEGGYATIYKAIWKGLSGSVDISFTNLPYIAPEVLRDGIFTTKSDISSIGRK